VGAWEEDGDTCSVLYPMTCDEGLASSDAICECGAELPPAPAPTLGGGGGSVTCDEASWPDKDHGLVCGECKVLVDRFSSRYKTCRGYCEKVGRQCVGAWEEDGDTCSVLYPMTCDEGLASSDAICECGAELPFKPAPALTPAPGGAALKVMSYNTQYSGYPKRVGQFGAKIRDVGAAVVGTQECQDKEALAAASGYGLVPGTGFQNPIFYSSQVSFVAGSSGWMKLPSDNYASRALTWAKFRLGSADFWFFNTHLPHRHGMAASSSTHSNIAQTLLQKRKELGAGDAPTVVVGDMNPFASAGAVATFESMLVAAGFEKSYQARGSPGFGGLDKIFASSHWSSSNGADQGTGSSDHPAIAVDLVLRASR